MVIDDSKSSCGMLRQEDCRKAELKPAGQSEFQVSPSYVKPCFLLLLLFLHVLHLQKSRLGERRERDTTSASWVTECVCPQKCRQKSIVTGSSSCSRHGQV